jgi:hypothetical protein
MSAGSTASSDLAGMTAALIVDGDGIERFAHEALQLALRRGLELRLILVCDNTTPPRRPVKHGAYYLYKLLFLRSRWTRDQPWKPLLAPDVPVHHFESEWEGIWQRVPAATIETLARARVDVVLRYGMTLLRDPDELPARYGVLSFHHGDPAAYRGRPAGFYEVRDGADHVGVIVQRLSNRLDAGNVLAYGAVKVHPHSYRRTLDGAFAASTYLLVKALRALREGRNPERSGDGKNYRLPDNRTVLRFAWSLLGRKARRLTYGLLYQKRWYLAQVVAPDLATATGTVDLELVEEYPVPPRYVLQADPVALDDGTVLCESVPREGQGRIVALRPDDMRELDTRLLGDGHLSYPHVVHVDSRTYLLPEMAAIGPQRLGLLDDQLRISRTDALVGLEDERLTDPTVLHHEGRWWLFAGKPGSATEALFLWHASEVHGPYEEHPDSPVVLDPACARMAGPVQVIAGRLYRLGQDNRGAYGDGITVCEIVRLDTDQYEERPTARLQVPGRRGPHTLDRWNGTAIVDLYDDRRDASAGLRRVRTRLRARSSKRAPV